MPAAELKGREKGLKEWAAVPPNRARACGVGRERASSDDRRRRRWTEAGQRRAGGRGRCAIGRMMSSASASKWREEEPKRRFQAGPAGPSPAAVSSIERCIDRRAAVVEGVG